MLRKVILAAFIVAVLVGIYVEKTLTMHSIRTVEEVCSMPFDGGTVILEGNIIFEKENSFILKDDTGKAKLITCPVWYMRVPIHVGDRVRVIGQLINNPAIKTNADIALNVFRIQKGRDTIIIRKQPGKPPWMKTRKQTLDIRP